MILVKILQFKHIKNNGFQYMNKIRIGQIIFKIEEIWMIN